MGWTLRADGIHQAPPLANGNYRDHIQDNQKYYQVKYDTMGWRLLDARSRFRADQPYLRQKTEGGWEIDQAKGRIARRQGLHLYGWRKAWNPVRSLSRPNRLV